MNEEIITSPCAVLLGPEYRMKREGKDNENTKGKKKKRKHPRNQTLWPCDPYSPLDASLSTITLLLIMYFSQTRASRSALYVLEHFNINLTVSGRIQ